MRFPVSGQVEIGAAVAAGVCAKQVAIRQKTLLQRRPTVGGAPFYDFLCFYAYDTVKKDQFGQAGHIGGTTVVLVRRRSEWKLQSHGHARWRRCGQAGQSKHAEGSLIGMWALIVSKCGSVVCGKAAVQQAIALVEGIREEGFEAGLWKRR